MPRALDALDDNKQRDARSRTPTTMRLRSLVSLRSRDLSPLLFAVPNGGRRDHITGARLKAEGVVAGVADLLLLVPSQQHHALCIEMKTVKGRQSPAQKEWQQHAETHGYRYEVVRDFETFERVVSEHLKNNE